MPKRSEVRISGHSLQTRPAHDTYGQHSERLCVAHFNLTMQLHISGYLCSLLLPRPVMQVRCIVRPRQNPADFLRDWGATTVQADLNDSTSLPAALVGIHTVIDCCTARPEESTQKIDWDGKVALIQCAQVRFLRDICFTPCECIIRDSG